MHRNDYALIGIATVASLLILIPLGIGLADAQISNSTLTITNSTGTLEYQMHWFTGEDMFKMPKIIKSLTKGLNHFIVFDDASYTLEDASKTEMATLANALTKIRHDVKGKCIVWMNIHYI